MIKCNLAVLLAERGLKMADIINETPLSKTAVRGLYYNESKGIQYETLEKLCDYLDVGPEDLIKKIEFSFEIVHESYNFENGSAEYEIKFTLEDKKYFELITVNILNFDYTNDELATTYDSCELVINFNFNSTLKNNVLSQLTALELERFDQFLLDELRAGLELQNHTFINLLHNHEDIRF